MKDKKDKKIETNFEIFLTALVYGAVVAAFTWLILNDWSIRTIWVPLFGL